MAYCGPKGIPLSEFLSWSQDDQDAALLWQAHENGRCSGCGTHPHEWDPDNGGDPNAYVAAPAFCPGCSRRDRLAAERNGKTSYGMHIMLRRPAPYDEEGSGGH